MGVRIYSERALKNSYLGRKHLKSKFLVLKDNGLENFSITDENRSWNQFAQNFRSSV